ncbi:MAG: flagellar biosynthesis protein FlhA [Planctomycetota bacterium]|nr:flagellar biosynthesis protein FlhA [Planctomycetota bacterium]
MNEAQMNTLVPPPHWKDSIGRNRDLALVIALAAILIAILVPLPGVVMDGLLGANIAFSVLVILTVVYLRKPLEFAAFPSMLLLATLYRLSLNIATTRLILSRAGEEGEYAAGEVVNFFGNFVSGSNLIVGVIIFSVLVVIQFVVVTKGATRIAEVAARFTLDRMPGAQMAIDANLNSGNITAEEAKHARLDLARQADFYGAMDGASKFVRGDAIAGIIITLINIFGGFAIGIFQYSMSFSEAGKVFTTLTIGDGLATQLPALFISIAAGLMVTRASTHEQIGHAVVGQVFANPRALVITAGVLVLLATTGLPPVALGCIAVTLLAIAYLTRSPQSSVSTSFTEDQQQAEVVAAAPARANEQRGQTVSHEEPLSIELGYSLHRLLEPEGGQLPLGDRIEQLRQSLVEELGFRLPPVRARVLIREIPRQDYRILLRQIPCASGSLRATDAMIIEETRSIDGIEGDEIKEPLFGVRAKWVSIEEGEMRKSLGYRVVSAQDALLVHLRKTVEDHLPELLTRGETRRILESVTEDVKPLVAELVPDLLRLGEVQKVLQSLLSEGVSIRDMEKILETMGEASQEAPSESPRNLVQITERVRTSLGRSICASLVDENNRIKAVTIDPEIEEALLDAVDELGVCEELRLPPRLHQAVIPALEGPLENLASEGHPPVVLTVAPLRVFVRKLLEKEVPTVVVLSYNEIVHGITVESAGMARISG